MEFQFQRLSKLCARKSGKNIFFLMFDLMCSAARISSQNIKMLDRRNGISIKLMC